jgi:uncharacterized protein YukE
VAQDPGVTPYSAKSNFEGDSHTRLKAMIHSSDPQFVMDVGTRLTKAHQTMEQLGNELMSRMGGLEWTGAAADSFKDWGTQVSKATLQPSEYTRVAGDFMTNAGETLSNVKAAMPDVPEKDIATVDKHRSQPSPTAGGVVVGGLLGGAPGALLGGVAADRAMKVVDSSWVTASEASSAQTRINDAHQQAIAQMEKLGQSYEMSTDVMKSATVPMFPPTPTTLMPPRPASMDGVVDVPVGGTGSGVVSGRTTSSGGTVRGTSGLTSSGTTQSGSGTVGGGTVRSPGSSPVIGGSTGGSVGTGIDGVTLAPPAPTTPAVLPGTGGGSVPGGGTATPPGFVPGGVLGTGGRTGGGRTSGSSGSGALGGRAGAAGRTGTGGRTTRPGFGGGAVGEGEGILGGGTAGRRSGYGGTAIGAEEGAHAAAGGRTTGAGGRGAAAGKGSAFDGGMAEEGHGSAGGHGTGGAGSAAGRAGRGGSAGRRLAMEEGGVVGGRRGPGMDGEFTPGGSGLRARAGAAGEAHGGQSGQGMMPGSANSRQNGQERRGHRPDYLVEDEETYASDSSENNPTVIE